jgi:hypothetical protein
MISYTENLIVNYTHDQPHFLSLIRKAGIFDGIYALPRGA